MLHAAMIIQTIQRNQQTVLVKGLNILRYNLYNIANKNKTTVSKFEKMKEGIVSGSEIVSVDLCIN